MRQDDEMILTNVTRYRKHLMGDFC